LEQEHGTARRQEFLRALWRLCKQRRFGAGDGFTYRTTKTVSNTTC
jgi:hypothetical protein